MQKTTGFGSFAKQNAEMIKPGGSILKIRFDGHVEIYQMDAAYHLFNHFLLAT